MRTDLCRLRSGLVCIALTLGCTTVAASSLIDPASYRGIAADGRSLRAGDLVTVVVLEAATASSLATTRADSETQIGVSATDGAGRIGLSGNTHGRGQATGKTIRSGEFRAQIAATVIAVPAPGVVEIEGDQELTINGERQRITLSGRVRMRDIGTDNVVLSSRISNGRITLDGNGDVHRAQRPSLIARLMRWLRIV
jgi:flagellar L-ring protein precursor FlgH